MLPTPTGTPPSPPWAGAIRPKCGGPISWRRCARAGRSGTGGENGREIPRRPWELQRLEEALQKAAPVDGGGDHAGEQ